MNLFGKRAPAALAGVSLIAGMALIAHSIAAQGLSKLPYMNPKLPAEERAADLVPA